MAAMSHSMIYLSMPASVSVFQYLSAENNMELTARNQTEKTCPTVDARPRLRYTPPKRRN